MYEYWQRVQKFELELPRRLINLENLAYRGESGDEIRNWLDECAVYTDYYYTDYMEIVRADPSCVTTKTAESIKYRPAPPAPLKTLKWNDGMAVWTWT